MGRHAVILAGLLVSVIITVADAQPLRADPPSPPRRADPTSFAPVIYEPAASHVDHRRPQVQAPKLQVQVEPIPAAKVASRSSVKGLASWYCKAGVSICHHSYPPGSMVAAACLKLRKAMGPDWRGQIVGVKSGSRSVTVRLVDWCGSTSKLIDLYWEPMRRLGGAGVLPVIVSWR